ncbi:MAG: molybdotransferase-like divisome protein Glp [Actinomycetales bacterium]
MTTGMRSVDDHLARALEGVAALPPLELQLIDARGCLLAEDVVSPLALPPFDNSAMDGYAVHAADVADATEDLPARLRVLGDIAAGSTWSRPIPRGACVRIMTGAPMPSDVDAVVPVELTDGGTRDARIFTPVSEGNAVRRSGEDVVAGEHVLPAGTRLGATQLGLLAALGFERVAVRPRPRVVVLSTGSELVPPGRPLQPGQIYDSNSYSLAIAAEDAGAEAFRVGIVGDEPSRLIDAIEDQLVRADVVITSGGVSAGAYDVVKQVLGRLGDVEFGKVAMQPGMPQGFGRIGPDRIPIFTLPGNPVSSFVSFEVFVRPVLRRMLGITPEVRPTIRARLTEPVRSSAGKRSYVRGRMSVQDGRWAVAPVGGTGSHLVADLALADCLIVVPEEVTEVPAGEIVTVMPLDRRQS